MGAIERDAQGELRPLTGADAGFVLRPRPEAGVYAPGHCCWLSAPDGETDGAPYLMYHARFGSPQAPRQFALARLRWDGEGRPLAEPPVRPGRLQAKWTAATCRAKAFPKAR